MALAEHTHEYGWCSFPIVGAADHAAGKSVGHIVNPEGVPIAITRCVVAVQENSTGAANLTIGSGASVLAAHDGAGIFAAAAMAAAKDTAVVGLSMGDAADALPIVGSGEYIVACTSADSSGLEARAYIEYIRLPE